MVDRETANTGSKSAVIPGVSPTNVIEGDFRGTREVDPITKQSLSFPDEASVESSSHDREEIGQITAMESHRRIVSADQSPCSDLTSCKLFYRLVSVDPIPLHKLFLIKVLRHSFHFSPVFCFILFIFCIQITKKRDRRQNKDTVRFLTTLGPDEFLDVRVFRDKVLVAHVSEGKVRAETCSEGTRSDREEDPVEGVCDARCQEKLVVSIVFERTKTLDSSLEGKKVDLS